MDTNFIDRATDALWAISPDVDRDTWISVGMAANAAGLSVEEFSAWSAQSSKYDHKACIQAWKSFKPNKGIGPGTLFYIAKEHGWESGERHASNSQFSFGTKSTSDVLLIWNRCHPATTNHPYVISKQAQNVPLEQIRVVPNGDPLKIQGFSMVGALVVPVFNPEGHISTLQFITVGNTAENLKAINRPTKLNLPNHSIEGWHIVGDISSGDRVLITEGIATAWACWQATAEPAVVAFGWGRVRKVVNALRTITPSKSLVICPDRGKENEAFSIAKEVCGSVAILPEEWPTNADFCDVALRHGVEAVKKLLAAAKEPPPPPLPFSVVPIADLDIAETPAPAFVWEGLIPVGEVTLLSAHGGTGKSFISMMLALNVARGESLFGVTTKRCRVVFFSGEDGALILRHRMKFLCQKIGISVAEIAEHLVIIDSTDHDPRLYAGSQNGQDFGVTDTCIALDELVQRESIGLLIIDNASDAFDASEIDRAKVRGFVRSLKVIGKKNNTAILLLAHVDKAISRGKTEDSSEGYSGSTAWHNSARSRLYMARDKDGAIVLTQQKSTHTAKLQEPLRIWWAENGVPTLEEPFSPVVQGISDRVDTQLLLRLIHEFTCRGEWISPGHSSTYSASKLLVREPNYPKRRKPAEIADLLRKAERSGYVERIEIKTPQRKGREVWSVTQSGCEYAGVHGTANNASTAQTSRDGAGCTPVEEVASAPPSGAGGFGGGDRARGDDSTLGAEAF